MRNSSKRILGNLKKNLRTGYITIVLKINELYNLVSLSHLYNRKHSLGIHIKQTTKLLRLCKYLGFFGKNTLVKAIDRYASSTTPLCHRVFHVNTVQIHLSEHKRSACWRNSKVWPITPDSDLINVLEEFLDFAS